MHMPQLVAAEICEGATSNLSLALSVAFGKADQLVLQMHGVDSGLPAPSPRSGSHDPGSTAFVALLMGESIVVANTGNSRAFVCSSGSSDDSGSAPPVVGSALEDHPEWMRDRAVGELRPVALSRPHEVSQPDERSRLLQAGATISGSTQTFNLPVSEKGG